MRVMRIVTMMATMNEAESANMLAIMEITVLPIMMVYTSSKVELVGGAFSCRPALAGRWHKSSQAVECLAVRRSRVKPRPLRVFLRCLSDGP